MSLVYYGLANQRHLRDTVVAVCSVLGYGGQGGFAVDLMMETAAQETRCGQYRDPTPNGAGRGLFQVDPVAFNDICQRARTNDLEMIFSHFAIDIKKIRHDALDYSPLLAAIFCRLFYKLIPDVIPASVEGRAVYWKKHYNTVLGAGTAAEYVVNAKRYAGAC